MRLKTFLPVVAFFLPVFISIGANLQLVSGIANPNAPSVGGNGDSYLPLVLPDGRYVLFASTANNLVPTNSDGPVNSLNPLNVFMRDRLMSATILVSVSSALSIADQNSVPTGISTNGQYVLFESSADNLAPGCSNFINNVFVRDVVNNVTTLVSVSTNGVGGNANSYGSSITPDGRYVVFASEASNLTLSDTNSIADVFVRDLQKNTTTLASTGATAAMSAGQQSGLWVGPGPGSFSPVITPDGRYVAFFSEATNLVPGAPAGEVYVRDLVAGTTTWASTNARSLFQQIIGTPNAASCEPAISTNGQWLVFETDPTNSTTRGLVLQVNLQTLADTIISTNAYSSVPLGQPDYANMAMTPDGSRVAYIANGANTTNTAIYFWNAQTQTNILVSADITTGLAASGTCAEPEFNSSGTDLTFFSDGTNLTANSLLSGNHLYLWNIQAGSLQLMDGNSNGLGIGLGYGSSASMNSDGSLVAFDLALNNADLIPNDHNRGSDVVAVNPATHAIELVSSCLLPSQTPNYFVEFYPSCVSTNGRYIAFSSEASDLADADTNDANDTREIFVRDMLLQTNILVSVDPNGLPGPAWSAEPSISGDGRYVAFSSNSTNLVAGVFSVTENVFLRDLQSATTALVSANISGGPPLCGNANSSTPTISRDGRYILFYTVATNVAAGLAGNSSGAVSLILRDNQSGTNYALSTGITWPGALAASMTPDGHYIAFVGEINQGSQPSLYVWNSQTASLIYTNTISILTNFCISPDGSWIAYENSSLWALNLQTGASNEIATGPFNFNAGLQFSDDDQSLVFGMSTNIYVFDFQTGTYLLVSRSFNSTNAASGKSKSPSISPDGRFVAYRSTATNIVSGNATGFGNIYLYDRANNATTLISVNLAGNSVANSWSEQPEFSADGSTLAFQSYSSDLAGQDFNEYGSIFALNLASSLTNSAGTNVVIAAQISGVTAATGQSSTAGVPVITWPGAPGTSYQVQFTDNLIDPVWQDVTGNMIFIGNNGQIMDLSPAAGQRFYRIVVSGE
jgi:Tol biopolymer transport system component